MNLAILLVSMLQCSTCMCICDIGSHGNTLGANSISRETRGVLLFTERARLQSSSLECCIDGAAQCDSMHTLCNRESMGGGGGHGGEDGSGRGKHFQKACQSEDRYSIEKICN